MVSLHSPLDWKTPGPDPGPDRPPGPVDVIVPVYGAAAELAACLAGLLRHTKLGRHRLVLVIDGPQESAVEEVLAAVAGRPEEEVVVLRNAVRRGFVGSVNRGMALSERDVVLLNSDTEVTAGWLPKLQEAACSDPAIATVTPFSNHATIASLPRFAAVNALPSGWSADRFAALVERVSRRERPRLPTGVGVCLYVKRKALGVRRGAFRPRLWRGERILLPGAEGGFPERPRRRDVHLPRGPAELRRLPRRAGEGGPPRPGAAPS
jgi:glycosyltransferase involved in cell wall biosynthesis